jgi:ankyrin repeat protein
MYSRELNGKQRASIVIAAVLTVTVSAACIALNAKQRMDANRHLASLLDDKVSEADIRRLIAAGADVNCSAGRFMTTPLMRAAELGDVELIRSLVRRGADLSAQGHHGGTPLYFAAANDHESAALLLLELGASCRGGSSSGDRPLMYAASKGRTRLVKALLERGDRPDAGADDGSTAYEAAKRAGRTDIIQIFDEWKRKRRTPPS